MVRVGLFYGGNALSGANLANDVGSGYRFGYFDGDLTFQLLGYTSETTVSMVKTQNVYYGSNVDWSGSGYYDSKTSDIAVGCYHLQLPQTYATFEEASAAAAQYSDGFPGGSLPGQYLRSGGPGLPRPDRGHGGGHLGGGDLCGKDGHQYGPLSV